METTSHPADPGSHWVESSESKNVVCHADVAGQCSCTSETQGIATVSLEHKDAANAHRSDSGCQ